MSTSFPHVVCYLRYPVNNVSKRERERKRQHAQRGSNYTLPMQKQINKESLDIMKQSTDCPTLLDCGCY